MWPNFVKIVTLQPAYCDSFLTIALKEENSGKRRKIIIIMKGQKIIKLSLFVNDGKE